MSCEARRTGCGKQKGAGECALRPSCKPADCRSGPYPIRPASPELCAGSDIRTRLRVTAEVPVDRHPSDRHGRAAGRDGTVSDLKPRPCGDPAAPSQVGGRPQGPGLARLSRGDASGDGDRAVHLLLARLVQFRVIAGRTQGRAVGGGPAAFLAGRSGDDPGGGDRRGSAQAARASVRRALDRGGLSDRQRLFALFWRSDRRRDSRETRPAQLEGRARGRVRPVPGAYSGHFTLWLDHRCRRRSGPETRRVRRASRS